MLPSHLRLIGKYLRGKMSEATLADELNISPMLIRDELLPSRATRIIRNLTEDYDAAEE